MQSREQRQVRHRVIEILSESNFHSQSILNGKDLLYQKLQDEKVAPPHVQYLEVMWGLFREGLVILYPIGGSYNDLFSFEWAISEKGRRYPSTQGQFEPDDPEGYLELLRQKLPEIDQIALRYIEESLTAYSADCNLAATVMLGGASERVFQLVGEAFVRTIPQGEQNAFVKIFANKGASYSQKLSEFRKQMESRRKGLSGPLRDAIDPALNGVVELLRIDRNEAGHPTGAVITPEQVRLSLRVGAHYMEMMYLLKVHFDRTAGP